MHRVPLSEPGSIILETEHNHHRRRRSRHHRRDDFPFHETWGEKWEQPEYHMGTMTLETRFSRKKGYVNVYGMDRTRFFFFYELLDGVYTISSLLLNFLFFIELARENMKTELVIGGYKWRANLKRDLSYSSSAFLRYLVNGYLQ